MSDQVVKISGLSCVISGSVILDGVDIGIRRGEYLSILGPNGAGKTTLLKCIMKIMPISGGSLEILGKELRQFSQKDLAREIGYVPQGQSGTVPFSVEEFVLMGRYPYLSPFTDVSKEDIAAMRSALETTGISDLAGRKFQTLSGGEKQLVLIAAVIAQGAGILLLDEPSTFLDPGHDREINSLLEKLNRDEGFTIVTVTHDVNRALLSGDRVIMLKQGKVAFTGRPEELIRSRIIDKVFGREFIYVDHPVSGESIIVPEARKR